MKKKIKPSVATARKKYLDSQVDYNEQMCGDGRDIHIINKAWDAGRRYGYGEGLGRGLGKRK